jgi:hypothetical protein
MKDRKERHGRKYQKRKFLKTYMELDTTLNALHHLRSFMLSAIMSQYRTIKSEGMYIVAYNKIPKYPTLCI